MSQIDDLSAGDSTPKLATASLKSLTLVVNRMAYAFKTPDGAVAPDMLQLAADGNLSLGGVPLVYSAVGRSFLVQNNDSTNTTARLGVLSQNGNAVLSVQGGASSVDSGLAFRDSTATDIAKFRLDPVQAALKLDMRNAGVNAVAVRVNTTGEVTLGDTTSTIARLQVMTGTAALAGSENGIFVRSLNPTTTPVMISGYNGGSLQIAGGNNGATGGRGGQIDFNSATWSAAPGTIVFRTGIAADGSISPEVGRWASNGWFGIGVGSAGPDSMLHLKAPAGTRARVISESVADVGGFTGRRTNGTYAAPTAVQAGDLLAYFNSHASYGGVGNYLVGATIQMLATQNWTSSAAGSSMTFTTVANGTTATQQALFLDHNGYAGFNTTTPQSRFVVAATNGGSGYEIDPTSPVNIRSIDRSTGVYQSTTYRAQTHSWVTGTAGALQAMMLEFNGSLGVGTTTLSGGAGNTAVEGKVILATAPLNAALTIADSGNGTAGIYSGLKFKLGTRNATSGGINTYDITVRPANASSGVANQGDMPLIRFEASQSLTPRLLLQPNGAGQQVVIGPGNIVGNTKLVVECENNWESPGILIGGKTVTTGTSNPNADFVIRRAGTVAQTAGLMPWMQLESTDAAFAGNNSIGIGAAANSFQVWNYISNAWVQKFVVGPTNATLTDDLAVTGNTNQVLVVRGPASTSSNIVVQSNTNQGTASWITSKTDGSFHIGANGGTEPGMGSLAITPNAQAAVMWGNNITQAGYTYAHGGTARVLTINNPDTTANAQGHLFISTGNVNLASSAIGGISFVLPNLSNNGSARLANMGAATDSVHTSGAPAGLINLSTKPGIGSTAIPRVIIRASGNVTFGNVFSQDTARLYVYNEGRNVDGIRMDMSDTSNTASSFVSMRADTAGYAFSFLCNGNIAGAITHPSATTTSYGTGSDRRIKKNIVDAPEAGDIIDSIRVVSHDFIADDYHVSFGLIAQELHGVFPQAVAAGDEELDITPTSKIWQVDNSKLVPLLLKEIQNQRAGNAKRDAAIQELRDLVDLLFQDKTK